MRLQTTTTAKTVKPRSKALSKRRGPSSRKKWQFVKGLLSVCLAVGALFALGVGLARFKGEMETLNRRVVAIRIKIHAKQREIEDLKVRMERMKGRFVLQQAKRFKLGLIYPIPGQVLQIDRGMDRRSVWKRRYRSNIMVSRR